MRILSIFMLLIVGCSSQIVLKPLTPQQLVVSEEISKIAFDYIKGESSLDALTYVLDGMFSYKALDNVQFRKEYADAKFYMMTTLVSPDGCTAILIIKSVKPDGSERVHEIVFMKLEPQTWSITNWSIGNK